MERDEVGELVKRVRSSAREAKAMGGMPYLEEDGEDALSRIAELARDGERIRWFLSRANPKKDGVTTARDQHSGGPIFTIVWLVDMPLHGIREAIDTARKESSR